MTRLDAALFDPERWFLIDARNVRIPHVVVPTLDAGLALIGHGDVATIVGRLRNDYRVVDIDLIGIPGDAVTDTITTWCRRRDLWHLVRPSGGAAGRSHVFLAPGNNLSALETFLEQLRSSYNVAKNRIDLRRDIRPLAAPHRTGTTTRARGVLEDALRELTNAGETAPTAPPTTTDPPGNHRRPSATTTAKTPTPRPRRALPAPWATYLASGTTPTIGGHDSSRSTVEAIATGHLLRAGHNADSAWTLITNAHPTAMTRAKASRKRWTAWVWNRAVNDDTAHHAIEAPRRSPQVHEAVCAARERLQGLQWAHSPRQRPALLLVGHHVLDRMERTDQRRVPVPERDLVLDTGITDRKTIRNALRTLNDHLGTLHTDTWDIAHPDSSSYEFEIPEATGTNRRHLSLIPPPNTHTPLPHGLWACLPRSAHSLHRALLAAPGSKPAPLAQAAGLTPGPIDTPTPRQLRTCTAGLTALAHAGLATCNAAGEWTGALDVDEATSQAADRHFRILQVTVTGERTEFRQHRICEWQQQRDLALLANRRRENQWWRGLQGSERDVRIEYWRATFDALSVLERQAVKRELALRRRRGGLADEATRRHRWLADQPPSELARRRIERQRWFESLPAPLQQANVRSWDDHRRRFAIPSETVRVPAMGDYQALTPDGESDRDTAYLENEVARERRVLESTG